MPVSFLAWCGYPQEGTGWIFWQELFLKNVEGCRVQREVSGKGSHSHGMEEARTARRGVEDLPSGRYGRRSDQPGPHASQDRYRDEHRAESALHYLDHRS